MVVVGMLVVAAMIAQLYTDRSIAEVCRALGGNTWLANAGVYDQDDTDPKVLCANQI